jgi:FkbM family methyltransferase
MESIKGIALASSPEMRKISHRGTTFRVTEEGDRWYGRSFWDMYEAAEWEEHTFSYFDNYIGSNTTFIDIGAAIGATALYAANLAGRTIAVEPNREVFRILRQNVELNPELAVEIELAAIHADNGLMEFSEGAVFSDIVFHSVERGYSVESYSLDRFLAKYKVGDDENEVFLKIDIEGGEFDLIASKAFKQVVDDLKPHIMLATHFLFIRRGSRSSPTLMRRLRSARSLAYEYRVLISLLRKYRHVYFEGEPFNYLNLFRSGRFGRGIDLMLSDQELGTTSESGAR